MKPTLVLPRKARHLSEPISITRQPLYASSHSVRIELLNILKSDGFVHAKRMQRFLEFVVEETLAGRANNVCEYSIGISVFGRDATFEPGLDPIVRNDARRLRQKLLEYYLQCGNRNAVVIEVPKGGYVPVFTYASPQQTGDVSHQYRLTARLSRADGTDVWTTDQEFQANESSEELSFALHLEVKNQRSPLSIRPISQSSNQAHRWNRSRERATR